MRIKHIELLHKQLQKIIEKHQPNCTQKLVDYVSDCYDQEHPDYKEWQRLMREEKCHNFSVRSSKPVLLIRMFLDGFEKVVSGKRLNLIMWRGFSPFINKDKDGTFVIQARWGQE